MTEDLPAGAVALADDPRIAAILREVCELTNMGFVAVARVTEARWIACHVLNRIDFDLDAGKELAIKTTICDDVRQCGRAIVIDSVRENAAWRTHPTPILYGFKSYVSFPIILADGSFFGTLCAIDPEPRTLSGVETMTRLEDCARKIAAILTERGAAD